MTAIASLPGRHTERRRRSSGEPPRRGGARRGYPLAAVDQGLTREAERLIERHVESVGTLDLLLLLRAQPSRAWTRDQLCVELRCPPGWVEDELERLRDAGLVAADDGGHRYAPATPRLRAAMDGVAGAWRRDRAHVARLILAPRTRSSER